MATSTELAAMRRAITLAAMGLGTTSPNPPVGCVILGTGGEPVGEGYHLRKGDSHAEVNAVNAAGADAAGGTAIVTLEPCNHHGRTPPCHQALIEAGIRRVVVALVDPTSRGQGGIARLRQAGIDVETGVLSDVAHLVLGPWLASLTSGRPFVRMSCVYARDGRVERALTAGRSSVLLPGVDAVLHATGELVESAPGAHRAESVSFDQIPLDAPEAMLATVHDRGVRSVLIDGDPAFVAQFSAAGLIDESVIYVREVDPSNRPSDGLMLYGLPGLEVVSVSREDEYIRIRAVRS